MTKNCNEKMAMAGSCSQVRGKEILTSDRVHEMTAMMTTTVTAMMTAMMTTTITTTVTTMMTYTNNPLLPPY